MYLRHVCVSWFMIEERSAGLDFVGVRHVVNFDLPNEIENYIHRYHIRRLETIYLCHVCVIFVYLCHTYHPCAGLEGQVVKIRLA